MAKGKYQINKDESEGEVLPNKLGSTIPDRVYQAELEGFLRAYKILFEELEENTRFNIKYLLRIHKLAFGHLYSFAGKLRTVNISKDGFMFPPAKFLEVSMKQFELEMFDKLPEKYNSDDELIKWIAMVHGELLFIHPFREGNGRTARLLANLMCAKAGHKLLDLDKFSTQKFNEYVSAVKAAAGKDYLKMEQIIRSLF